jgi:hypothetical protein
MCSASPGHGLAMVSWCFGSKKALRGCIKRKRSRVGVERAEGSQKAMSLLCVASVGWRASEERLTWVSSFPGHPGRSAKNRI